MGSAERQMPYSRGESGPATSSETMRSHRDAYAKAIDKVREEHSGSVPAAQMTLECPKCGTRQVVSDAPGRRICVKCGFEFRPLTRKA